LLPFVRSFVGHLYPDDTAATRPVSAGHGAGTTTAVEGCRAVHAAQRDARVETGAAREVTSGDRTWVVE
ncbi:MAG: hypothetical protein ACXWYC_11950, partial [Actinomycetota bacterium]